MHIDSLAGLRSAISGAPAVIVYFDAPACAVSTALAPKLQARLASEFPRLVWLEVDISQTPDAAAQSGVSATPTVVIYFEGKEHRRFSRSFAVGEVIAAVQRPYALLFGAEPGE